MLITVGNVKGGVGKTNTAIHLAAYFQQLKPTLLVDSDRVRSSLKWYSRGKGTAKLPFSVVDWNDQEKAMREKAYSHIVFDTEGGIDDQGLKDLAAGCDLLVIPAVPETTASDGLIHTLQQLEGSTATFRVLLSRVRHNIPMEAAELRAALVAAGIPIFTAEIPELVAFNRASAQGIPVYAVSHPRAARAWEAIEAVGKEIIHART
jgi:chromosome partitioning protein